MASKKDRIMGRMKSQTKSKKKKSKSKRVKLTDAEKKENRKKSSRNYYARMKSDISLARKKKRQRANIDKCIQLIKTAGMRVEQDV